MKLLIIEPHSEGHRAVYVARIVRAAVRRGHEVVVAMLESARDHLEYHELVKDNLPGFSISTVVFNIPAWAKRGALASELAHWLMLRRLFLSSQETRSSDVALVPYLDYCLHAIALLGSPFSGLPFAGIVMKVKFHHHKMGINTPAFKYDPVKERLFIRLLDKPELRYIFSIDEALAEWMEGSNSQGSEKVVYVRDPSNKPAEIASPCESDGDAPPRMSDLSATILVYGWLNRRKGIQHLIPVLYELMTRSVRVKLLCIGRHDAYVTELLAKDSAVSLKQAGLLSSIDRYVTADEEIAFFEKSDFVWLAYEDFFVMSGVMVQAGMMGKPVLVSDKGLVSWMTRKRDSGIVVHLDNHLSILDAILKLAQDKTLRKSLGANALATYSEHTVTNFTGTIIDRLEHIAQ